MIFAGYCLDNIQEGISTISGAGRGAFATKAFEKDSIITVAPLIHLKHSDLYTKTRENESTFQMLLNYCFGHRKSDILLCPVSNIALINHNSEEPNAKIQWSKPSQNRIDADTNYRAKGLNELSNNVDDLKFFNTKLAIEIVAIKAIDVGEEIFLNYGQEWEVAMTQHVEFWSRTKSTLQNDQNHLSRPVFRHYVPFPDTLFPFRWREDYAGGGKLNLGIPKIGLDLTLSENERHHEIHESMLRSVECGIYFAPSNIPNAGFGTFTAVPVAGKGIVTGTHMPAIPVIDNFPRKWNGNDYVWNSESYFAEYESSRQGEENILRTTVLGVHEGALANSHLGLVNEYLQSPTFDPVLDRCKDPGAGAFSDYVRYSFKSEYALQIGQELFVSYGDAW
jgi:SET domain